MNCWDEGKIQGEWKVTLCSGWAFVGEENSTVLLGTNHEVTGTPESRRAIT